jgi:DNA-binding transcriptional MerR regulator
MKSLGYITLDLPVTGRCRMVLKTGGCMEIRELEARTGVTARTIRYYEKVGVLPPPRRKPNRYREYDGNDVERLKFVLGARQLDFSLDEISEILALRDRREAPCRFVLDLLEHKALEVAQRIEELKKLEKDLRELHELGTTFPLDDVDGKNCVCHLVSSRLS